MFGAVQLAKNADIDKCRYFPYGIEFDTRLKFSFPTGEFGCNVIIFGVIMSCSLHGDNKKKYILFLGEGIHNH